jgi:hypothetical protein
MAYRSLDAYVRDFTAELADEHGWDTADINRAVKAYSNNLLEGFHSGRRPEDIAESIVSMED